MASPYSFARGDTIALALQVTAGDPLCVSSIKAAIRPALGRITDGGVNGIMPSAQAVISFVPASGSTLAYWIIAIAAGDSYNLPSGDYAIDAEIKINSLTITTNPAPISIIEPSTVPAIPTNSGYGQIWANPSQDGATDTLTLQWIDAMDASAYIFPAANITLDPNVIALMETTMAPINWPLGSTINFLTVPRVRVQIDSLSGLDSIVFSGTLNSGGTTYTVPAEDESGREYQSITSPGIYTVPGMAYLTAAKNGSVSTPAITYLPIYF